MPALNSLRMPSRGLLALAALTVVASIVFAANAAIAQSATGTVTGRVVWGACVRGIPLPMSPDAQPQPGVAIAPDASMPGVAIAPGASTPDAQSAPASRPVRVNGLPAGAVLVALQNTGISARTDEAGKFSLSGVPAGQYMTVAAGPVADSTSAVAERPNVFVSGGQSVDVGTLSLGGSGGPPYGIPCRPSPAVDTAPPDGAPATTSSSDVATP